MKYPAFDLRCAWHMWIFLLSLCTWLSKLHWKILAGISFLFLHLASDLFFSLTVVIAQPRGRASGKFGFRILKIITCGWSCQGYAVSGHAMPWNKRNRILEHKREELSGSRRGAKAGWWWWRRRRWVWSEWWGVLGVRGAAGEDGFIFHPCPFFLFLTFSFFLHSNFLHPSLLILSFALFPSLSVSLGSSPCA